MPLVPFVKQIKPPVAIKYKEVNPLKKVRMKALMWEATQPLNQKLYNYTPNIKATSLGF